MTAVWILTLGQDNGSASVKGVYSSRLGGLTEFVVEVLGLIPGVNVFQVKMDVRTGTMEFEKYGSVVRLERFDMDVNKPVTSEATRQLRMEAKTLSIDLLHCAVWDH